MFFLLVLAALPFKLRFFKPFETVDLAILLFAAQTIFTQKICWKTFFWDKETRFLTLFLILLIFSAGAISYRTLEPLIALSLFYFLACGGVDSETIKKGLWVIVGISLFEGAVACGQYFTQSPVGLKMLGEVKFTSRHLNPAVYCAEGVHPIIRAYGTLIHPNVLGGFLTFCLFASYPLFLKSKRKWIIAAIIAFQLFALFLTFSRAALLGLIAGSILWFYLMRKEKGVIALAVTLAASFLLCLIVLYPQLQNRGGIVSYNSAALASDAGRLAMQENAFSLIRDHPFLGVGFGRYLEYFRDHVHNIYLLIGAETGLIGLGLFLMSIFSAVKTAWPFKNDRVVATFLSIFLALLVIGMCDFYLWIHAPGRAMLFVCLGITGITVRRSIDVVRLVKI